MDQLKLPIALVVAMVLQISGGVWWVSQQAQNISQLQKTVAEMSSRMAIEENVNMKRDITEVKSRILDIHEEIDDMWEMETSLSMLLTEQIKLKGRLSVIEKELEFFERDHKKLTNSDPMH